MKYFIDTEFAETGGEDSPTIDLISLAIVAEDGIEYYWESSEFNPDSCNDFVKTYVLPRLSPEAARVSREQIRREVFDLMKDDENPEFWSYYGDYDWVVFCWLFGRMVDLPDNFPKFCMDLQQWWVQLGKPDIKPIQNDGHHALVDARWNRDFYEVLSQRASRDKECGFKEFAETFES